MAIRKQHGKVSTIAQLAGLAGKSLAARRDYERREAQRGRIEEMQLKSVMREKELAAKQKALEHDIEANAKERMAARDWESQKLALRSQQAFGMEAMKQQAYFERELAKEIKKMDEYDLAKEKLAEMAPEEMGGNGRLSKRQHDTALAKIEMRVLGQTGVIPLPESPQSDLSLSRQASEIEAAYELQGYTPQDLQEVGLDPVDFPAVGREDIGNLPPVPAGRVRVISPDGQTGTLAEEDLLLDEYKDYRRLDESSEEEETFLGTSLVEPKRKRGSITPVGALWNYAQLNRQLQMEKMRQTKKSRGTMSLGERLRR